MHQQRYRCPLLYNDLLVELQSRNCTAACLNYVRLLLGFRLEDQAQVDWPDSALETLRLLPHLFQEEVLEEAARGYQAAMEDWNH